MSETEKFSFGQRSYGLFLAGSLGNALVCIYLALSIFSPAYYNDQNIFEVFGLAIMLFFWGFPLALTLAMTAGHLVWAIAQWLGLSSARSAFIVCFLTTVAVFTIFFLLEWNSARNISPKYSAFAFASFVKTTPVFALISGVSGVVARNTAQKRKHKNTRGFPAKIS